MTVFQDKNLEPKIEFLPFISLSQLEYENLVRADEALKIVTELLQAEKGDYANIKPLKIVVGITD